MKLKSITEAMATITLTIEPEHDSPEGNFDSGDADADAETLAWIRSQLASGNEWAWCCACVTAEWNGFKGTAYLGGCSYRSEEDFRHPEGYYPGMVADALDDLNRNISETAARLAAIEQA